MARPSPSACPWRDCPPFGGPWSISAARCCGHLGLLHGSWTPAASLRGHLAALVAWPSRLAGRPEALLDVLLAGGAPSGMRKVLRGFWSSGRGLCLWGRGLREPRRQEPEPGAAGRPRPHPFAVLADALAEIQAGRAGEAVLLLPSLRTAPLDSPELIRVTPRPLARSRAALLPWRVPVVMLDRGRALRLPLTLAGQAPGIRSGASLAYLGRVAEFAQDLVSRGRVLPDLARDQRPFPGPVLAATFPAGARCRGHALADPGDAAGLPRRTRRR